MRQANVDWNIPKARTWEQAGIVVLMDLRDRLDVLNCGETRRIPAYLRDIRNLLRKMNPQMAKREKRRRLGPRPEVRR